MAQRRALTAPQVAALKKDGQHWVAPSLYLNIKEGQGTRSWLFRYRRQDGSNQWMGLGSVEEKTLSEARDEAAMLRVAVKRGGNPIAAKREVQVQRKIEMKPKVPTSDIQDISIASAYVTVGGSELLLSSLEHLRAT